MGNDYAKYVEFMHLVYCDAFVPTEVGFNGIVKLLYGISGFENYLLVFAFFALFTVLIFLAAIYRQADSFGFSFFLFMAFGYYFQSFNTVRYYLALAIALYAIPYVLKRQWGRFIFLVLLGATLHKSVIYLSVTSVEKMAACPCRRLLLHILFYAGFLFKGSYFFISHLRGYRISGGRHQPGQYIAVCCRSCACGFLLLSEGEKEGKGICPEPVLFLL